ncbi:TRAP transporter small permease subunit [Deltaproteobacteria bacterium OttesenSCG-928-M10]|nr:TRAP transporter small permease subunit [Deltaproteobacteria bacterium OttesenSCG-928-M10]
MKVIQTYIRIIDTLSEWIGRAASMLIPVMVIILLFEVIARYAFNRPTLWGYDMAIFMYGYCGILGGMHALKHKKHIIVDVVFNMFKPRTKSIMNVFTGLLFFFFIIVFVKYTWDMAMIAWAGSHRTSTAWGGPVAHYRLLLPVGATLLGLQGLANWFRDLYFAITGAPLADPPPAVPEIPQTPEDSKAELAKEVAE